MSIKNRVLLGTIIVVGLFLRLYGLNWDQGFHLHPDERFLTMVSTDISFPSSISEYFNRHTSSLNPENNKHTFFVYGLAPITINKFIGDLFLNTTYDTIHLQGRLLSAIADSIVILVIYKIVEIAEKRYRFHRSIKYLSAFFYSIAVLPIQLSHFFAVDTFLNMFGWVSVYYAIVFALSKKFIEKAKYISLTCIFLGLSFASKMSAIYFVPLISFFILIPLIERWTYKNSIIQKVLIILCGVVTFYLTLRIGSPYYFESGNILDPRISSQLIQNLKTLKTFDVPGYFPPATQWINAPWYLSQLNMFVFGLGIPYSIFAFIGIIRVFFKRRVVLWVFICWSMGILGYQVIQYAKTMRYLVFIYPIFAIYAAIGFYEFALLIKSFRSTFLNKIILLLCGVLVLIWPAAFMSIYTKNHSRVDASYWIYDNVPNGSTIAWEYWDDPLPLLVENPAGKQFKGEQIGIFDPDTPEKWNGIQNQLSRSDYYIMSSNRGWGSIPTVPERYPLTTDFYKDMFANKRGFTLIKEFTSYPSLFYLGIPIDFPDQWAEEAFTVYDHPKVMIFKKNNE